MGRIIVGLVVTSLCLGMPAKGYAKDTLVVAWNQVELQAVRETRLGPPMVARALAMMHTAQYDAWAAYDPIALSTRLGGELRRPREESTLANKEKALSYAAYRVLLDVFPSQSPAFHAKMIELSFDPSDTSLDPTTPQGIGNRVAAALLEYRHHDGSNQLGICIPAVFRLHRVRTDE